MYNHFLGQQALVAWKHTAGRKRKSTTLNESLQRLHKAIRVQTMESSLSTCPDESKKEEEKQSDHYKALFLKF